MLRKMSILCGLLAVLSGGAVFAEIDLKDFDDDLMRDMDTAIKDLEPVVDQAAERFDHHGRHVFGELIGLGSSQLSTKVAFCTQSLSCAIATIKGETTSRRRRAAHSSAKPASVFAPKPTYTNAPLMRSVTCSRRGAQWRPEPRRELRRPS